MAIQHKFATVINCIDGRTHLPVINWVKSYLNVEFVDMITEPGPDKTLSQCPGETLQPIKDKITISINAHKSNTIVVVGHHDCAGNPVSEHAHHAQIIKSVDVIKSWELVHRVIGLWINDKWEIEKIYMR